MGMWIKLSFMRRGTHPNRMDCVLVSQRICRPTLYPGSRACFELCYNVLLIQPLLTMFRYLGPNERLPKFQELHSCLPRSRYGRLGLTRIIEEASGLLRKPCGQDSNKTCPLRSRQLPPRSCNDGRYQFSRVPAWWPYGIPRLWARVAIEFRFHASAGFTVI